MIVSASTQGVHNVAAIDLSAGDYNMGYNTAGNQIGRDSFAPLTGLGLRMALAFLVGSAICTIGGYAGLNIREHGKLYFAASISLFPNMALVYLAATYIPSGLIALLFGLSPFFTALLSRPILGEGNLQPRKLVAIGIAVCGLGLIFSERSSFSAESSLGIFLMLLSNLLFSSSALWVKRITRTMTVAPMEQALGAMAFSLPGLLATWFFVVGFEPIQVSAISVAALLYLSFFGSLLGFVAYYYILNQFSVEAVSLIPLITPILAMVLGVIVVDEMITFGMVAGASLILVALAIHQQLWNVLKRRG